LSDLQDKNLAVCHECDLLVDIEPLLDGHKAACPRCGYIITRAHKNAMERMLVFSLTAMLFLFLSTLFSFIKFEIQGQERNLSLLQTVDVLLLMNEWALGLFILLVIIGIPVLFTAVLTGLLLFIKLGLASPVTIRLLHIVEILKFWNMGEIFFLGVLISMIKLASQAEISLGFSFWAYAMSSLFLIAAILHADNFQLANAIKTIARKKMPPIPLVKPHKAAHHQLLACHSCATVQPDTHHRCSFCNSVLHRRKQDSLQRTWLYLLTGIVMYLPANIWPIMVTNTLGNEQPSTIIGGIVLLWEHGSYPIAAIIFIASVAVPVAKFLVLIGLLLSEHFRVFDKPNSKTVLYRITEFVGRWSMVDVFVVAFLASLIQLGNIASIYPGPAVLAFGFMVVATMLAAASFDPRLFWDSHEQTTINKRPKHE
jgi:paraquat-inducible protein A